MARCEQRKVVMFTRTATNRSPRHSWRISHGARVSAPSAAERNPTPNAKRQPPFAPSTAPSSAQILAVYTCEQKHCHCRTDLRSVAPPAPSYRVGSQRLPEVTSCAKRRPHPKANVTAGAVRHLCSHHSHSVHTVGSHLRDAAPQPHNLCAGRNTGSTAWRRIPAPPEVSERRPALPPRRTKP